MCHLLSSLWLPCLTSKNLLHNVDIEIFLPIKSVLLPYFISNKDCLEETIYSETKLGNYIFLWKVRVENHLVDFDIESGQIICQRVEKNDTLTTLFHQNLSLQRIHVLHSKGLGFGLFEITIVRSITSGDHMIKIVRFRFQFVSQKRLKFILKYVLSNNNQ